MILNISKPLGGTLSPIVMVLGNYISDPNLDPG